MITLEIMSFDSIQDKDLLTCLSVLKTLRPIDIRQINALTENNISDREKVILAIRRAGIALFSKAVREELFNDQDVITFLQQNKGVNKKYNKLTRLHEEITRAHAAIVEENSCAGINSIRETKTQEVNIKGLITMTTAYADDTLIEGFGPTLIENDSRISSFPGKKENLHTTAVDAAHSSLGNQYEKEKNQKNKGGSISNYSRKKEFKFDVSKVRGMYDDSSEGTRRRGIVYLLPRGGSTEGGWLSFVEDGEDCTRRACSLRTVEMLLSAMEKLGSAAEAGQAVCKPCTYVIGERLQKWAYLGGAVEGLSGETAIAVLISLENEPKLITDSVNPHSESIHIPPVGSFRRHCNICKQQYISIHFFYHQLCCPCGDLNYEKRQALAPMRGKLCLVTGGRVRIGYQICLKLLRSGAEVITTTRWVYDAALRYSYEADFQLWRHRLHIDQLELGDLPEVERYCEYLHATFSHIDVLINNAAQTLTRPFGWIDKMQVLEYSALAQLTDDAKELLGSSWIRNKGVLIPEKIRMICSEIPTKIEDKVSVYAGSDTVGFASARRVYDPHNGGWLVYDESGQPLDLSGVNSWSKRLSDVNVVEMTETMAVNSMAPFLLCSRLKDLLIPLKLGDGSFQYTHIINVNALEGKFNVGKKSGGHPHTNMAKAALNMLTLTSARQYAAEGILMNSVDTGWVTDMAPKGVGAQSRTHETFVGPPLDDLDGAARVLDPIFSHINSKGNIVMFGSFWKDYMKSNW